MNREKKPPLHLDILHSHTIHVRARVYERHVISLNRKNAHWSNNYLVTHSKWMISFWLTDIYSNNTYISHPLHPVKMHNTTQSYTCFSTAKTLFPFPLFVCSISFSLSPFVHGKYRDQLKMGKKVWPMIENKSECETIGVFDGIDGCLSLSILLFLFAVMSFVQQNLLTWTCISCARILTYQLTIWMTGGQWNSIWFA